MDISASKSSTILHEVGQLARSVQEAHNRIDQMEPRLTRVETQVEERWRETIIRIKRIEHIMIATAAAIIGLLVTVLTKMG